MMKWKDIVTNAETVKKGVEKEGEMPSIKGYNVAQLCYIFAKAVRNPGKDIADKKVSNCPDCTGSGINMNLNESEYKTLAKHTIKWIDERGVAPNYTLHGKYMVSIRLQTYCYAKIIVWYDEHSNTLPLQCLFNNGVFKSTNSKGSSSDKSSGSSTSNKKKYGRSTKQGCDNRGQNTDYYCACHMAQEIVRNLTGKVIPQKTIASVMGTTTSGTGHGGIDTFFAWFNKKYGYNLQVQWKNFSEVGWNGIKKILESSNQDCGLHELYKDTWGHYTNFDKVYSDSVDVHNSLGNYCSNGCHCGYEENRSKSTAQRYLNGISQKSVIIVTRK